MQTPRTITQSCSSLTSQILKLLIRANDDYGFHPVIHPIYSTNMYLVSHSMSIECNALEVPQ